MLTCVARIVSHSQRVSIIIRVHREKAYSKGAVLGVCCAIFKVLQVDSELVVPLDGQGMDLLQPCRGKERDTNQNSPLQSTTIVLSKQFKAISAASQRRTFSGNKM